MAKSNQADSQIRTRDDFDPVSMDEVMTMKPCNDVRVGDVIMLKGEPLKLLISRSVKQGNMVKPNTISSELRFLPRKNMKQSSTRPKMLKFPS